jgi:hypothetical protein
MAKNTVRNKQNFVCVKSFKNQTGTSRQALFGMKRRGSVKTVIVQGVEYVNLNESGLTQATAKYRRDLEIISIKGESLNFED